MARPETAPEIAAQFLFVLLVSALILAVGLLFSPFSGDRLERFRARRK
jgi:hypothetical protein